MNVLSVPTTPSTYNPVLDIQLKLAEIIRKSEPYISGFSGALHDPFLRLWPVFV